MRTFLFWVTAARPRVIPHTSAVLVYFVAEACNHVWAGADAFQGFRMCLLAVMKTRSRGSNDSGEYPLRNVEY